MYVSSEDYIDIMVSVEIKINVRSGTPVLVNNENWVCLSGCIVYFCHGILESKMYFVLMYYMAKCNH
jgi:hypothetical protein